MQSIQAYTDHELMWTPLRASGREYELRAGDAVLATLVQPSAWRERRIGAALDGSWSFACAGVWRPRVVVTDTQSGAEVARIARSGWSGKADLDLPDGHRYQWRSGGAWGSKWAWLDDAGQPLMRFSQSGAFKVRCAVTIAPKAAGDPHLILLAMLGWYLMLLTQSDAVAATVATVAVVSSGA